MYLVAIHSRKNTISSVNLYMFYLSIKLINQGDKVTEFDHRARYKNHRRDNVAALQK